MPSKKKTMHKRRTSRKSTSWLTRYKPRDTVIYRPDVGLGRSVATRLKTVVFATVATSTAAPVVFQLLPGSCFNPLGDLTSIQPASFDQWKVLFARYLVTGATVHFEVTTVGPTGAGTSITATGVVAAYPSTVVGPNAASATFQGYASQPYAQSLLCPVGASPSKMTFKLSAQKIVGSRLPVLAEDQGALISASPTTGENMVMPVLFQEFSNVSTSMVVKVTIIQDVVFDQRIQVVDA